MPAPRRIPRPRTASPQSCAPRRTRSGATAVAQPPGTGIVAADVARAATVTAPRRSRARAVATCDPLGSLTQRDHRSGAVCRGCGSLHVTRLTMSLTDGTPVDFTSCHRCEHRTWEHAGGELTVQTVLDRARKG